jgi:C4-type Zn-finger protein
MHKCEYCGYRFEDEATLEDHIEYVVRFDPVLCK